MSNITNNDTKDPLLGRSLGDFLVEKKLGEGGFGAVYKATQITLSRPAVIKVLHTKHRENQNILERFKREAYLASRLEHPYMAHIYSFGAESDGLLWIAMEMVAGTPLDEILKSQGALPLERFIPLLDKICEVVYTAHEAGIIHRDLKPANVMVISRAGRLLPKLLDFGIAKGLNADSPSLSPEKNNIDAPQNLESKSSNKTTDPNPQPAIKTDENLEQEQSTEENKAKTGVIGSPPYMSPEQWGSGTDLDTRTDIYALGVMSYEILTGEVPFRDSGYALMYAHLAKPVPALGKAFAPVLDSIIAKAMAKKPEDRYQSALEFAKDFREAAGFSEQQINLPQLDELLKENLLANAPKPLADTVASLVIARNTYQFRDRLLLTFRVLIRYVGVLTLASYVRSGANQQNNELISKAITSLRQHGLSDSQWAELSRELCRPFAKKRDAFPIPELINLFFAEDSEQLSSLTETFAKLLQIQHEIHSSASLKEEDLVKLLADFLAKLTSLLNATTWLSDYYLVLPEGSQATKLMGKGQELGLVAIRSSNLASGKAVLVDAQGYFVLSLWPLVEVTEPTPGTPLEVFLLERKGRSGAKLVSFPDGFEIETEAPWQWVKEHFLTDEEKKQTGLLTEKSPYLGLTTFSPTDSNLFYGREKETESFLNRLRIQPLLAVVGPSGAGKSSFVQAGVVAGLGENWQVVTVRPGLSPLATLASKLSKLGIEISDLKSELQKDIGYLGKHLRQFASKQNSQILLVVDQFEEIITLCLDKQEQSLYVEALVSTARSEEDPVRVVLTMRDDFLVRAKELKSLKDRLTQGLEILTTPDSTQLLRILTEPARQAGYEFEDRELPVEIVDVVAGQTSALPLIAFTAVKLWEQRDKEFKQLRRRSYELMGGVGGTLAKHAEEMMQQMSQTEQSLVREAFRHLVTSEGTRAVLIRPELLQLLGKTSDGETVIEKLISARLLVATEGEKGVDRIEVVHEALLSAWPRLVKWRQEDAEGARLRDQLRSAARQWQERNYPKGLLWRDEALTEYQLWRTRYQGNLTELEEAFGKASTDNFTRGQRTRLILISTAIVVLFFGFIVVFLQRQQAVRNAEETKKLLLNSYEEQGRQELVNGNPYGAAVYLSEAYKQGKTSTPLKFMLARAMESIDPEIASFEGELAEFSPTNPHLVIVHDNIAKLWDCIAGKFLLSFEGHKDKIDFISFSHNGKYLLTTSHDKTLKLWDASNAKNLFSIESNSYNLVFSNDDKYIAGVDEKDVKVFNVSEGKLFNSFTVSQSTNIQSLCFSPDGKRIATASIESPLQVWDTLTGTQVFSIKDLVGTGNFIEYDKTGKYILVSGNAIKTYDAETGQLIFSLQESDKPVYGRATLSPDGNFIAVSEGLEKTANIWDTITKKKISTVKHSTFINSITYNSNSQKLLTTSADKTAKIWHVKTGVLLTTLYGHNSAIDRGRFNYDSKFLYTLDRTKRIILWSAEDSKMIPFTQLGNQDQQIEIDQFNYTQDGKKIVVGDDKGTVTVWDARTNKMLLTINADTKRLSKLKITYDGKQIITQGSDQTIKIWNLETGKLLFSFGLPLESLHSQYNPKSVGSSEKLQTNLIISPNGKSILIESCKRIITYTDTGITDISDPSYISSKVIDVDSGKEIYSFDIHDGKYPNEKNFHLFNNKGNILVSSSKEKSSLLDLKSGKILSEINEGNLHAADFTEDLSMFAAVTKITEEEIGLYEVKTGLKKAALKAHTSVINSIVYGNNNNNNILSASWDGTVKMWDVLTAKELISFETKEQTVSAIYNQDSTLVITLDRGNFLKFWDKSTGKLLASYVSVCSYESNIIHNPDFSNAIISTGKDVRIQRINIENRSPDEIAEIVKRKVPFKLEQGRLVTVKQNQ